MAYMHMSVDTSEDGIIEDFAYSTYRSTGNSYGDMFSRPESLSDRTDEAMDMLLYIYDKYYLYYKNLKYFFVVYDLKFLMTSCRGRSPCLPVYRASILSIEIKRCI